MKMKTKMKTKMKMKMEMRMKMKMKTNQFIEWNVGECFELLFEFGNVSGRFFDPLLDGRSYSLDFCLGILITRHLIDSKAKKVKIKAFDSTTQHISSHLISSHLISSHLIALCFAHHCVDFLSEIVGVAVKSSHQDGNLLDLFVCVCDSRFKVAANESEDRSLS